jgi:hypothetical protein
MAARQMLYRAAMRKFQVDAWLIEARLSTIADCGDIVSLARIVSRSLPTITRVMVMWELPVPSSIAALRKRILS